jgi:hypothetical protein
MCWAAVIGATVAGLGAAIKNAQATRQAVAQAEARNRVLRETMAQNRAIADDSRSMFNTRVGSMTGAEGEAAEQAAFDNRQNIVNRAVEAPVDEQPIAGSAPQVVRQENAKAMAEALDGLRNEARTSGRLAARGDHWFNQGIANTATGRDLGINANIAGGNLALLPHLQDLAEYQVAKPTGALGDIMIGVGNALGSYGGSKFTGQLFPGRTPTPPGAGTGGVWSSIYSNFYGGG